MSVKPKHTAVVALSSSTSRLHEALRAAVGLGLRGAHVTLILYHGAGLADGDLVCQRALATLAELGHHVRGPADLAATIARSDAVEVWT